MSNQKTMSDIFFPRACINVHSSFVATAFTGIPVHFVTALKRLMHFYCFIKSLHNCKSCSLFSQIGSWYSALPRTRSKMLSKNGWTPTEAMQNMITMPNLFIRRILRGPLKALKLMTGQILVLERYVFWYYTQDCFSVTPCTILRSRLGGSEKEQLVTTRNHLLKRIFMWWTISQ